MMKEATFKLGYPLDRELETQNLTANRIIIKSAQGVELQIQVEEDGIFKVYLDDVHVIRLDSKRLLLVSMRYRA